MQRADGRQALVQEVVGVPAALTDRRQFVGRLQVVDRYRATQDLGAPVRDALIHRSGLAIGGCWPRTQDAPVSGDTSTAITDVDYGASSARTAQRFVRRCIQAMMRSRSGPACSTTSGIFRNSWSAPSTTDTVVGTSTR